MATYHATVDSTWPADAVFDYLATFSNAAEWDPGVLSAGRRDAGPLGVGTVFHLMVRFRGRGLPLDYEIVAFDPPRRVRLRASSAQVVSEDTITCRPGGSGTVVDYHADLRMRGVYSVVNPILGPMFQKIGDRGMAGLAAVLAGPVPRTAGR